MQTVFDDTLSLDYKLIRSARRKTVGLQVKAGQVIVRAPCYVADHQISALIQAKSSWLLKKVDEQLQQPQIEVCRFSHGSVIWIFGIPKTLLIHHSTINELENNENEFVVNVISRGGITLSGSALAHKVKKMLEGWFKTKAEEYFTLRVPQLSALTGLSAKAVKIRQYQARWGSCNNKGDLSFNYLLMMAPLSVIDYVITHELCHLTHLNHSAHFWRLVSSHCPSYQTSKMWLKSYQMQLQWKL